ncbi:MAG: DUF885 domain-containing protein [Candidatus Binatia bacterium]
MAIAADTLRANWPRVLAALALATAFSCAPLAKTPSSSQSQQSSPESRRLNDIFENYFEAYLELFPLYATQIGDHRYDHRLAINIDAQHRSAQRQLYQETLEQLAAIERSVLAPAERLFHEVLDRSLRLRLEASRFPSHLLPVRQLGSLVIEFPLMGSGGGIHPFKTVADYDNFLQRIDGFVGWVDSAIVNMREGIERGVVQPRAVIDRTLPQLDAMIVADPQASLFYQPIRRLPAHFSSADGERLSRAYQAAIEAKILTTYRKLSAFVRNEYLPATRQTTAWSALPDGEAWYDYLVRSQTTSDLTPDEIFQLGLDEIARIGQEMERLRRDSQFSGTIEEFAKHLSHNTPRPHRSRAALVAAYQAIARIVQPQLAKLFGRIPAATFEVRAIEEFREQAAPSQYWSPAPDGSRPGIFYVNARGIENSPRRPSEPLFLHEAIPGHHFQISLQMERNDLPRFQRFGGYSAFSEGWALYAESLGHELGLYADTEQYFSRLNSELFRAARLVVDVGLHRKGWTRAQALKIMAETTFSSEDGVASEIDRYIANPAQALTYKIGQLAISAIRVKAETALGNRFDLRAFHDELLKDGALPMSVLQAKMARWIAIHSR